MRIFLAVDLDEGLRSRIGRVQQSLAREGISGIRWTNPDGIHLTLRFCGEVSPGRVARLQESLAPGAPHSPFSLRMGGLGTFPARGAPRVLFLSVAPSDPLDSLAAWVEERVVTAGLAREPRPFHPHLTLGRFRPGTPPVPSLSAAPGELGQLTVDRIVLFESRLTPGGARYEALQSLPLLGEVER
jgi:2'-5' RNA ligase